LVNEGILSGEDVEKIRSEIGQQIDAAEAQALDALWPEPKSALNDLYAD
jgi:TPP-dependent pyruvate/acetoin dehydrogenase alpha subunit